MISRNFYRLSRLIISSLTGTLYIAMFFVSGIQRNTNLPLVWLTPGELIFISNQLMDPEA